MMMVIIMMTVNRQAIHSFDLYGDDETKVVVSVTKMLTYQMTTKKVNEDLCLHTVMFNSDGH